MSAALGARIYCERRRLLFVAVMAFLAGVLFYLRADVYVHGVHIALITGAVYALVVGLSALVVCVLFPSMRFMIEAIAVSRLVLSLFVLAVPNIGYQILASPFATASLVVIGGALVSRLLHGRIVKETGQGWFARLSIHRRPVRIEGNALQLRIVGWLDGSAPLPVRV